MDPLTVMSLVCNIIQVVDFGTKVAKRCRALRKNGALSENEDLEDMASRLKSLCTNLEVNDQSDSDILLDLARKCSDTADSLVKELHKLKVKEPRQTLEILRKSFQAVWRKSAIDAILERLDSCRKALDTHVLFNLRDRFDLLSLQQTKGFEGLDATIQTMTASLAAGPKGLDELAAVIHSESESIKHYFANSFQQHRKDLARQDYIKRFLESLWFPDIYHRQRTIKEAHKETFQWIYETGDTRIETRRWDDFAQWLEKGHGIYWIHGKAGSGKSTLMNYIHQNQRTYDLLKIWSGTYQLLCPSFFFWNVGSDLEKTSEGLLRSLLFQILQKFPDKIPSIKDHATSEFCATSEDQHDYELIPSWTEDQLRTTLCEITGQLKGKCAVCIFIDGLDEFVGDQTALIATVKGMQNPDLKICLSSRPDSSYHIAFGSFANLKLQYLTEADIANFVSDRLQTPLESHPADKTTEILHTILSKAEGVFLWVELVVKEILRGLQKDDDLDLLTKRLELMPSGIEQLYAHMLRNIDRVHEPKAAELFRLALADLTGSLLDVSLVLYNAFDRVSELSKQDVLRFCDMAEHKIPTMCAGLLEIRKDDEQAQYGQQGTTDEQKTDEKHSYYERWRRLPLRGLDERQKVAPYLSIPLRYQMNSDMTRMSSYERCNHVEFIHRTSRDFLLNSREGASFMSAHRLNSNPYTLYVRALLAKLHLFGFPHMPTEMANDLQQFRLPIGEDEVRSLFVYEIMKKIACAERITDIPHVWLYEEVNHAFVRIYQQGAQQHENTHWCSKWGFCELGFTRDLSRPLTCSSSQICLPPPCHSALSLRDHHHGKQTCSTKPTDFLGLACSWGMLHYVKHAFESGDDNWDQDTATHLLCCSLWAFHYYDLIMLHIFGPRKVSGALRLVEMLLKRGANPNFYIAEFGRTIWEVFLHRIAFPSERYSLEYGKTMRVFMDSGADLHILSESYQCYHLVEMPLMPDSLPLKGYRAFRTFCKEPLLLHLRRWLDGGSDPEGLEECCISNGVCPSPTCIYIGIIVPVLVGRWYKVSEAEFAEFNAIVTRDNHGQEIGSFAPLRGQCVRDLYEFMQKISDDFEQLESQILPVESTPSEDADEFYSSSSMISLGP